MRVSNRSLAFSIDGGAVKQLTLPDGVATGGGFATIASSYGLVEFDNFTIQAAAGAAMVSRCAAKPAVGQAVVAVGCGEPLADRGAMWEVQAGRNHTAASGGGAAGLISLRSDPTLCIASVAPPSLAGADDNAEGDADDNAGGGAGAQAKSADAVGANPVWNGTANGHGATIRLSKGGGWAEWSDAVAGSSGLGCDAVALGDATTTTTSAGSDSHWVRIAPAAAAPVDAAAAAAAAGAAAAEGGVFADIGWCSPDIDKSGNTWMGTYVV